MHTHDAPLDAYHHAGRVSSISAIMQACGCLQKRRRRPVASSEEVTSRGWQGLHVPGSVGWLAGSNTGTLDTPYALQPAWAKEVAAFYHGTGTAGRQVALRPRRPAAGARASQPAGSSFMLPQCSCLDMLSHAPQTPWGGGHLFPVPRVCTPLDPELHGQMGARTRTGSARMGAG